jgi:uncharacterized membrane protein YcaP (DUF421 family)
MNPQAAIEVGDVGRLLHGSVGWAFLPEALIRIGFVYLLLLVSMRLMGGRLSAMLSRSELAAMVSLAAATGAVIATPDRGLLPALVVCAVIVGAQRLQAELVRRSKRVEQAVEGDVSLLVIEGELELRVLDKVQLSRERVFAQLRSTGITHLGRVQRLYMEAHGGFSLIEAERPRAGLSIIPDWDQDFAATLRARAATVACTVCGHLEPADRGEPCPRCQGGTWARAVES